MIFLHASTAENASRLIAEEKGRVVVDFYKEDCPACRMVDKSFEQLKEDPRFGPLVVLKIKLEVVGEDYFKSKGLRQTPTLVLYDHGIELKRVFGFQTPKDIVNFVLRS